MGRLFRLTLALGMLSAASCGAARAGSPSIVSVSTPPGVQQAFILIKPDHPVASVILFEGGDGNLGLTSTPPPKVGAEDFVDGNFLVRSRVVLAARPISYRA